MIKLYTWKTPNGYKVPIFLEEAGLEYEMIPVNIGKGEQKTPEYIAVNPISKIPAIVDDEGASGPITIFESGAILLYLAEKTGKFMPSDISGKYKVTEWLMFQMASVGPMLGQLGHFVRFAPEKIDYAINRYTNEAKNLVHIMDEQLAKNDYIAGDYSIADIAIFPWVRALKSMDAVPFSEYPHFERWFAQMESRPAVMTAFEKVDAATAV